MLLITRLRFPEQSKEMNESGAPYSFRIKCGHYRDYTGGTRDVVQWKNAYLACKSPGFKLQ